MANDINTVTIIGRLTADAELRTTTNGSEVCNFSIAVNRKYKDVESVSFFSCVLWGKPAVALVQYLTKGKRIGVMGRLEQSRWQGQDGKTQSRVSIVGNQVQFLDSKKGDTNGPVPDDDPEPAGPFPEASGDDGIPF